MGVFISYSSKDIDALENLVSALRRAHKQVWIDEELRGGENWWREILEEIRNCDVFVFAMSGNSLASKPCLVELSYAEALNKPILPVIVGPITSMRVNPLADIQAIDYRNPDHYSGIALIGALYEREHRRLSPPATLPPEPPVPYAYLMRANRSLSQPRLSTGLQAEVVSALRGGLDEDGHDESARHDIAQLLLKLRERPEVADTVIDEVDHLLRQIDPRYAVPRAASQHESQLRPTQSAVHKPPDTKSATSPRRRWLLPLSAAAIVAIVIAAVSIVVMGGKDSSRGARDETGAAQHTGAPGFVPLAEIEPSGRVTQQPSVAPADPAGDRTASCPPVAIAVAGALSGPDAALGINVKNGALLAIDKHNVANPNCQVSLKPFDTEGDPQLALGVAPAILDDPAIIGLIGPGFSGEAMAIGAMLDQAGLASVTASATNPKLSENGWRTFFRALGSDGIQGPAVASYLKNTLGHKEVCVVADDTLYGVGLAEQIRATLGRVAVPACNISVKKGDTDFTAAATQIKGVDPDSVFYSGYYPEAARLVQQLRSGGFTGTFASGDGTKDPEFVNQGGDATKDAIASCPCLPLAADFAKEYSAKFGMEPGTYTAEAYDVATIMLTGIDSGATTRPALLDFLRQYDGQGIARRYQWTPTGELMNPSIWLYRVE